MSDIRFHAVPGFGPQLGERIRRLLFPDSSVHNAERILFIFHDHRLLRSVGERLFVDTDLKGLFFPRFHELANLARETATGDGRIRLVSPLEQDRILEAVVRQARDRLNVFGRIAGKEGFVRSTASLISDLEEAGRTPESLIEEGRRHPTFREILVIYEAYRDYLAENSLIDEALIFSEATALLKKGESSALRGIKRTVVFGLSRLPAERVRFLRALLDQSEEADIFVEMEPGAISEAESDSSDPGSGVQGDLFDGPVQAIRSVTKGLERDWSVVAETDERPGVFKFFMGNLLRIEPSADKENPRSSNCMAIMECPGAERELEIVAAKIKSLLLDGGGDDLKPSDIIVVLPEPGAVGPAIRRAFRRLKIPYAVGAARPLSENRWVRTALALLNVPQESPGGNYQRRLISRFLQSSYIAWPAEWRTGPEYISGLARELGVVEGKEDWLSRFQQKIDYLKGRIEEFDAARAEDEDHFSRSPAYLEAKLRTYKRAFEAVKETLDTFSRLDGIKTFSQHLQTFIEVMDSFRMWEKAETSGEEDDRRASGVFRSALGQALDAWISGPSPDEPISLKRFERFMQNAVRRGKFGDPERSEGGVRITSPQQAFFSGSRILIIAGMEDGKYPLMRREAELIPQRLRRELGLPSNETKTSDGWYDFYRLLGCAADRIYFSYPAINSEGEPALRSAFIDEIERLAQFAGLEIPRGQTSLAALLPDAETGFRLQDILTGTMRTVGPTASERKAKGRLDVFRLLDEQSAQTTLKLTSRNLLAKSMVAWGRQYKPNAINGAYTGALSESGPVMDRLLKIYDAAHVFSASQVNDLAQCPFKFFLGRVLRLERLEEPSEVLSPLDRGGIYHRILHGFFSGLQIKVGATNVNEDNLEERLTTLRTVGKRELELIRSAGIQVPEPVWRATAEVLLRNLEKFISDFEVDHQKKQLLPILFEVPFGLQIPDARSEAVVEAVFEATGGECDLGPIRVDLPDGGAAWFHGQIDRVDLCNNGAYLVIDYKSGFSAGAARKFSVDPNFQMPVYLWALQSILDLEDDQAVGGRFVSIKYCKTLNAREDPTAWSDIDEEVRERLAQLLALLRAGDFRIGGKPCRYCDFESVCRAKTT